MDKEEKMFEYASQVMERNAIEREKNAVLSCALALVTVLWLRERHKRLHKKEKTKKEGE